MATLAEVVEQLQSQQITADKNAEKNVNSLKSVKGEIAKLVELAKPTMADKEADAETKRAKVSGGGMGGVFRDSNGGQGSGLFSGLSSGLGGGLFGGITGAIGGMLQGAIGAIGLGAFAFGKTLGLGFRFAALTWLAPILGDLVSNLLKGAMKNIDIPFSDNDESIKSSIATAAGDVVEWGIYGSMIGRIFGKRIGLIFTAGGLAYKWLNGWLENDDPNSFGKSLSTGWEEWFGGDGAKSIAGIGAAIAAGLTGWMTFKVPSMLSALNPFASKVPTTTAPTIVPGAAGGANTPAKVSKSVARKFHRGGLAEGFSRSKSGALMRATGQGGKRVFSSVDEVMNAMQLEKAAKFAKYAKALRFLGVIGTISAAALDPAMAMYEGKSDEEIKKQLAGALGGIGGAAIGGALGSVGLVWTGPGAILGGLVGAVGGGLLGEWGLEKLAEHLLSPDSPQSQGASIGGYSDSSPVNMGGTYDTSGAFTPNPSAALAPATVSRSGSTSGSMLSNQSREAQLQQIQSSGSNVMLNAPTTSNQSNSQTSITNLTGEGHPSSFDPSVYGQYMIAPPGW